jgi:putative salt-induced outer membrane protein YdiY
MRTLVLAVSIAVFLAVPAAADELTLKNGDRITGQVVRVYDGQLTFKTPAGDLVVVWNEVAGLTTSKPLLVTTTGGEPELRVLDGLAPGDIVALAVPPPPLEWNGAVNVGFVTTDGNTQVTTTRLDGELIAVRPKDRASVAAIRNHAEDSGEETADNTTVALNYDRFLSDRLYINGNAIFTSDEFKSLDLRTALGAAVGYDVWKSPRGLLSINGGLGYVNENFEDPVEDDDYFALREGLRARFAVVPSVELFHNHDTYIGLTGDDNLFFKMQTGVRFRLIAGLVSTLQWDLDYDRSPAPGRENTDRTFAITLGYRF